MKKLLFSMAVISLLGLKGMAQEIPASPQQNTVNKEKTQPSPEEAARRQMMEAGRDLGLNEDQKKKFYDYSLIRINANRPLKKEAKAATDPKVKKALHKQIKANRQTFDANVKAMLDTEQLKKWEASHPKAKTKEVKPAVEEKDED